MATDSTTIASTTNKAGINNQNIQQPRLQQPTKPDSTTKKAGFNNQNSRIQQPWLQQPKKPVSTTKRFNNQGFNNQQSRIQQPKPRIQQPQSSTTKGSTTKRVEFKNQGWGGAGGGLIALRFPFCWLLKLWFLNPSLLWLLNPAFWLWNLSCWRRVDIWPYVFVHFSAFSVVRYIVHTCLNLM